MKYGCLLGLMLCFLAFNVQAADKYSSIVSVDVTDVNAATAKEKAMAEANRRAVNSIIPEFADERALALMDTLSDEQILYFIKEATVLEEKSSDVRYIASLRVTIQDRILRQYLYEKGVAEEMPLQQLNAIHIFSSLADWLKVEQKLKALKVVEKVDTIAMARQKVQFRIVYRGEVEDVLRAAEAGGMYFQPSGNIYIMTTGENNG